MARGFTTPIAVDKHKLGEEGLVKNSNPLNFIIYTQGFERPMFEWSERFQTGKGWEQVKPVVVCRVGLRRTKRSGYLTFQTFMKLYGPQKQQSREKYDDSRVSTTRANTF